MSEAKDGVGQFACFKFGQKWYNISMEFEYDINKSKANREKHGLDFERAIKLWESDYLLTSGYFKDEIRYLLIGKIEEKIYTCVYTKRFDKIRIISCRRSRKSEEVFYYEKNKK